MERVVQYIIVNEIDSRYKAILQHSSGRYSNSKSRTKLQFRASFLCIGDLSCMREITIPITVLNIEWCSSFRSPEKVLDVSGDCSLSTHHLLRVCHNDWLKYIHEKKIVL